MKDALCIQQQKQIWNKDDCQRSKAVQGGEGGRGGRGEQKLQCLSIWLPCVARPQCLIIMCFCSPKLKSLNGILSALYCKGRGIKTHRLGKGEREDWSYNVSLYGYLVSPDPPWMNSAVYPNAVPFWPWLTTAVLTSTLNESETKATALTVMTHWTQRVSFMVCVGYMEANTNLSCSPSR